MDDESSPRSEEGIPREQKVTPWEVEAADVHQIRDVLRGELIERRIALAVIVAIHVGPVGAVVDGVVQFRLCRAGRVCGAGCNRQNDNTC